MHNLFTLRFSITAAILPFSLLGHSVQNLQPSSNPLSWTLQALYPPTYPSSLLLPQFQERNTSACLTFCSHTLAITLSLLPPTCRVSLIENGHRKEDRKATNYLLSFKKVKSGFALVWRSSILVPKTVCYMITQTIRVLLRRIANSFLFTELLSYS